MDPINTEVVSQTRYNLKLLGYVVIVALLAFGAFAFLNRKQVEEYSLNEVISNEIIVKEIKGVDYSLPAEKRLDIILNRIKQGKPLSHHEKSVILEQFSAGGQMKFTDEQRKMINSALNK